MSDDFTKMKFAWLDQISADPEVTPLAFRVAYVIVAQFLNRKTRTAWPSIARIAALVHKSRSRVQEAVTNLIERKHLGHRRGGTGSDRQGKPSTYWIVFIDNSKTSDQSADRQDEIVSSVDDRQLENETSVEQQDGLNARFQTTERSKMDGLNARKRDTNPLNEPI